MKNRVLNEVGAIIERYTNLMKIAVSQVGEVVPQVTAFNQFGRYRVENWISAGKLTAFRRGRRVYFYLWDIEDAANVRGVRAGLDELTSQLKALHPAV